MPDFVNKKEHTVFVLLITGYFEVLYHTGQTAQVLKF